MKILISQNQGMCFGVRRALEIAQSQAKAVTYGSLVHNKEVVSSLEKNGINVVDDIDKINKGDIVIIRAHGISDKELEQIIIKGANVLDATCPFVSKTKQAAKEMEKNGYQVIILGQKDHPEVKGIAESLESPIIIADEDGIPVISGKIGLVSQTTQSQQAFNNVVVKLNELDAEIKIENTICSATENRQKTAQETARQSDIMLVIGDKGSANTNKLAELCSEITQTRHIESASELNKEWFVDKDTVGITAGASTPEWIVDEIINKLKGI